MLSVQCPQCGKPAPVDLSAPEALACDACGFSGAPDPEAAQRIEAARALVLGMDAKRRQLGTLGGRALGSATVRTLLYVALAAMLSLPVLGFAAFFIVESTWLMSLCAVIPAAFLLVTAFVGLLAMRRAFGELADACAARPPRAPGEPARCHVCGGGLSANSGVARCSFCKTDNLVDSAVVARVGEFHDDATADLQASVERRSALVSRTWRRLSLLLFGSLLTGPLVMCLGLGCLVFAPQPELDPDDNEPVTLVERDGLSCTGQMTVDGRLWFGGRPESGYWAPVLDADEADYAWVDPSTLIGRRVRVIGIRTMDGRFDRIVGSLDSGNFAIVVTDDSEEHTVSLAGLCPLD